MRQKLFLSLVGGYLHLQIVGPQSAGGLTAAGKVLLRLRGTEQPASTPQEVPHTVSHALAPANALKAVLESAWDALSNVAGVPLQNSDLEVRLGAAHSRLGLLRLADDGAVRVKPAVGAMLVNAWIRQTWTIDPQSQIVRWHQMQGVPNIVFSCIPRDIFEDLESFCGAHKLRFVSCMPVLMEVLMAAQRDKHSDKTGSPLNSAEMTLACTEGSPAGQRSDVVQLLRLRNQELNGLWRGRIPPSTSSAVDEPLEGAVRRFQAFCKAVPGEVVRHWHLPAPVVGARS